MIAFLLDHPTLVMVLHVLLIVGIAVAWHKLLYHDVDEWEAVEESDPWNFPPRWHPDPAETHLGKHHLGQRRGK